MSRLIFLAIFKFLALLVVSIDAQNWGNRQKSCEADGQQGVCQLARECPILAIILQQQSRDRALSYLRRNHCGFEGSHPLVCCIITNSRPNPDPEIPEPTVRTPSPDEEVPTFDLSSVPYLPKNCGRDLSQKIFGGERTELDEFPWMVLLEYQKPYGRSTGCGGVLINNRYVLTAAHCVKGPALPPSWRLVSVRLGEYNTETAIDCVKDGENSMQCADSPISVCIEEQIVHESYRRMSPNQNNDIALLRLSQDVPNTRFMKPICLPSSASFSKKLFAAGWGKTQNGSSSNIKLKVELPLANKETCAQTYSYKGIRLSSGQICAGGQPGKDSCKGDSGGPLMGVERLPNGIFRWAVLGIVSFGPLPCGQPGWAGVYTRVFEFVPWIVSKLRA